MKKNEFDFKKSFPSLGHPEHHFNKHPNHPWLKNKEAIFDWLNKHLEYNKNDKIPYVINIDLTVTILSKTVAITKKCHHLPIQIRESFNFDMDFCNLESFIGTPYICKGYLSFVGNRLHDFSFLTPHIKTELNLEQNRFKSFKMMPNFTSKKLKLEMTNNPIESWEGFTSCNELWWWQNQWTNNSKKLFLETPDTINCINISELKDYSKHLQVDKQYVNMPSLRKEIESIRLNDTIENSIADTNSNLKRRKL